jgi:hypothetical protein
VNRRCPGHAEMLTLKDGGGLWALGFSKPSTTISKVLADA